MDSSLRFVMDDIKSRPDNTEMNTSNKSGARATISKASSHLCDIAACRMIIDELLADLKDHEDFSVYNQT